MTLYKSLWTWCLLGWMLLSVFSPLNASTPFACTQPAARLSKDASTLTGMAVPNGEPTLTWFELGVRGRYDLTTPAVSIDDGDSVVAISSVVSNLPPNTAYQARLVARNSSGTTYGVPTFFASTASALGWGDNWFSQSGVPATPDDAVAIAAGGHHTLMLRANGKVAAFGYNACGQTSVPSRLADVIAVAAGENHSVALKSDGSVIAWGCTAAGQTAVPAGL